MASWFRRDRQRVRVFVLSGYDTASAYEQREPSWEPDDEFPDIDSATAAAISWRAGQPTAAQVEVVEVVRSEGRVRRVVDETGIEEIA